MKEIKGLENVKIFRPGYAIEYDYFPPTQLRHTLETKQIANLYFAGQICGTTGYEEAAAQGIIAGINAHLKIAEKPEFTLRRDEAYIGVLIDDLVTKGVDEPYRMFTSRAEYRILLRQDNADDRLTQRSHAIGLASQDRVDALIKKKEKIALLLEYVLSYKIKPEFVNEFLLSKDTTAISNQTTLSGLLGRPQVNFNDVLESFDGIKSALSKQDLLEEEVIEAAELKIKYEGYIDREKNLAEKFVRLEEILIPEKFDFSVLKSISTEGRQKLNRIRPHTIGQASRIPGVSPSDINILLIKFGR